MKWASISATRSPTADEMRRWGYLAKARVYQMEMESIMAKVTLIFPTWPQLIAYLAHSGRSGSVTRKQGQWVFKESPQ